MAIKNLNIRPSVRRKMKGICRASIVAVITIVIIAGAYKTIEYIDSKKQKVLSKYNNAKINTDKIGLAAISSGPDTIIYYTEGCNDYSGKTWLPLSSKETYNYEQMQNMLNILDKEQVANPSGLVVYVDGDGIAYYYLNFRLVQKVNLKTNRGMQITSEDLIYLVSDPNYLSDKVGEDREFDGEEMVR